jgi:hypothetical protein
MLIQVNFGGLSGVACNTLGGTLRWSVPLVARVFGLWKTDGEPRAETRGKRQ